MKLAVLGFGAISAIYETFKTLKTFFLDIGSLATGIGNIIAAIGGLLPALSVVAAAVIGWKIGEWINEKLLGVDTPSFFEMMNGIKSSFTDGSWKQALVLWGNNILASFKNVWKIAEIGWKNHWNFVKKGWEQTVQWIKETIRTLQNAFRNIGTGLAGSKIFGNARSGGTSRMSTASLYSANPAFAALAAAPIPKLATGAVIPPNREFLAVLGDQKSGTNIEAPLEMIEQANKKSLLGVLEQLGITGGGNSNQTINLNLTVECEGYQLLHIIQKLDREYFKQHGKDAFT